MARIGIIARADLTGLGIQSRNWVRLLNPHKVVVIDSSTFNHNQQHFEWYSNRRNVFKVNGFIKPHEINSVLYDIDVLLTFEIPYNYELISAARAKGIKTIIQNNWEFTDYLQNPGLPLPDLLVNHSYWHLDDQKKLWPDISDYCPTPLFVEDYDDIMLHNVERDATLMRRFVHIAGRRAYKDRNGTQDVLEAMKLIPPDYKFELVIKAQNAEVGDFKDPRITLDRSSPVDEKELYRDFDAMILPRRYAGASLPMNESLAAGLPVIMTDIDPNNKVLPKGWLVPATVTDSFMARTMINVHSADYGFLADKIIQLSEMKWEDLRMKKIIARRIAEDEYSSQVVKEKWARLMYKIGL